MELLNAHETTVGTSALCRSDSEVVAGWANTRGRRSYNEDNIYCDFCAIEKEGKSLEVGCLGVFDGHGGAVASAFLKENLFHSILHDENFPKDIFKAIGAQEYSYLYC